MEDFCEKRKCNLTVEKRVNSGSAVDVRVNSGDLTAEVRPNDGCESE